MNWDMLFDGAVTLACSAVLALWFLMLVNDRRR